MRGKLGLLVAAAVVVSLGVFGGAAALRASEPPTQDASVPAAGATSSVSWTGTIPTGTHPSSDCSTLPAQDPTIDHHGTTIHIPATGYTGLKTTFTFRISWSPLGAEDTSDQILTVVSKEGDEADQSETREIGSSDGSATTETVSAINLPPGDYDVMACGFVNAAPQTYTGTLGIASEALAAEPTLPSADAQGLQFSAAVASDPQRDIAEPLLVADKAGNLYECGPSGFSNGADYAQVSTDGGDQFHLLGLPPRGQQSDGGGGDCGLATGEERNAQGNYQYAYTGLGALSGFATATSPDNGHTLYPAGGDVAGGVTSNGALADRQWMTFLDDTTVLLTYNQQVPRNAVVVTSTDGGLTYSATSSVAAPNPTFPGPIHYIKGSNTVFMPWTKGEQINLTISQDRGVTWTTCRVGVAPGGTAGFATADNDSAGNVYVAWADKTNYHTWMASLAAAKLGGCNETIADVRKERNSSGNLTGQPTVDAGFSAPVEVDRDAVRTTVFPWIAAGGAPGRVAVAFYGTTKDGDPNTSKFKAAWDVYVNQSLNALDTGATFSQVAATTHPFHYDSICLNGLGCDVTGGDRSLADFFAITFNPATERLSVVFDRANKKPDDAAGYVATPMVATQIAGPSNGGGTVAIAGRDVVRATTSEASGDALVPYSSVGTTPTPVNAAAGDFAGASIGPDLATHGFTVTLRLADLSDAALSSALTQSGGSSLLWIWRFTNGWQDAAAVAKWSAATGFSYGYDDYTNDTAECRGGKCEIYPGRTPIAGSVDRAAGTITLVVPASVLHPLGAPDADGRPTQAAAAAGSRFYDGTAFSFSNVVPEPSVHSWLTQLDNTPAFDFLLPAAPEPVAAGSGGGGGSSGGGGSGGGGTAVTTTAVPPVATTTTAAPPAPSGGVAGVQAAKKRFVRGSGLVRGRGSVGNARFRVDLSKGPSGKVVYATRALRFHSVRLNSVRFGAATATLRGRGSLNGRRVSFTAVAVDNGAGKDVFRIAWGGGPAKGGAVVRGGVVVR